MSELSSYGEERIRGGEGLLRDTHGSTIPGPFPTPRRSLQGGEWKASHSMQILLPESCHPIEN